MTPAAIIREAQVDAVKLALSNSGTIRATGERGAVNRWLAVIREHKAEIIEVLKVIPRDTVSDSRWLAADEERSIRAWLALIEETDEEIVADVIRRCAKDADARDYFIVRAANAGRY